MERIIIGVDGGGSKSTAAAADATGRVLAVVRGESLNYNHIGIEKTRNNLNDLVSALTRQCGADYQALLIGLSAVDRTADADTVRFVAGSLFDPDRMVIESDAYMALLGLTQGAPGLIAIAGTGSMLVMDDGKNGQQVSGGWGYILGDPGSGYALAADGLRAAIACWEGTGPKTVLADKAIAFFNLSDPRELIERVYAPGFGPRDLARFGKEVLNAAEEGDPEALGILDGNMQTLAKEAKSLLLSAPDVRMVGLYGGVFQHAKIARSLFEKHIVSLMENRAIQIVLPEYPPELGALIHHFRSKGQLTDALLKRMLNSYKSLTQKGTSL